MKVSCESLKSRLERKGFRLDKVAWLPHGYIVSEAPASPSLGSTIEYLMGYYYIQGLASMIPAYVLQPNEDDLTLDMAAAPGGKTTQLSQLMRNRGVVVAVERSSVRAKSLRENVQRMGASNVIILRMDVATLTKTSLKFRKILLDAPCSGEGLIPFYRRGFRTTDDMKRLSEAQLRLIKIAHSLLEEGGELVYSTCAIGPEENERVIGFAVEELGMKTIDIRGFPGDPGITEFLGVNFPKEVRKCLRLYPHKHGTEGFFVCHLTRV